MMRRSTPNRSSSPLPAWLVFILLLLISGVLWGISLYAWSLAYYWFAFVEQWTAIFTLLVPAAPFALYFWLYPAFANSYNRMVGVAAPEPLAPAAPQLTRTGASATGDEGDWIAWLGRGERHRGVLVFWVVLFGSIFYWSSVTWYFQDFTTLSFLTLFSAWGLITSVGTIMVRALFVKQTASLPGPEVSAGSAEKKSASSK